jgi:hypothetical protein
MDRVNAAHVSIISAQHLHSLKLGNSFRAQIDPMMSHAKKNKGLSLSHNASTNFIEMNQLRGHPPVTAM